MQLPILDFVNADPGDSVVSSDFTSGLPFGSESLTDLDDLLVCEFSGRAVAIGLSGGFGDMTDVAADGFVCAAILDRIVGADVTNEIMIEQSIQWDFVSFVGKLS
jgi:hypothetical protein